MVPALGYASVAMVTWTRDTQVRGASYSGLWVVEAREVGHKHRRHPCLLGLERMSKGQLAPLPCLLAKWMGNSLLVVKNPQE